MDLPAGDYVLTIGGFEAGGGADDYAFRLLDLASAEAAALDAAINDSFDTAGETKLYRFTATAGDSLTIERLPGDFVGNYNVAWRLYDPFGREANGVRYLGLTRSEEHRVGEACVSTVEI